MPTCSHRTAILYTIISSTSSHKWLTWYVRTKEEFWHATWGDTDPSSRPLCLTQSSDALRAVSYVWSVLIMEIVGTKEEDMINNPGGPYLVTRRIIRNIRYCIFHWITLFNVTSRSLILSQISRQPGDGTP